MSKLKASAPQTKVYTRLETITPERAKQLMLLNVANRGLKGYHVRKIANDITTGKWQVNGSCIVVSCNNILLDGQHRLAAIIIANQPVDTLVTYNVADHAFTTIDVNCRGRMASDVLSINGYTDVNNLASASTLLWRVISGIQWGSPQPSGTALEVLRQWPSIEDWNKEWSRCTTIRKFMSPAAYITTCVYLSDIAGRTDLARQFTEGMQTGANLSEGSPVLTLRNRLGIERAKASTSTPTRHVWRMIVRAIDALEEGRKITYFPSDPQVNMPVARPKRLVQHMAFQPPERSFPNFQPASKSPFTVAEVMQIDPNGVSKIGNS
ncbi:hypothetical protein UFOVP28_69 [uncultured Caudovirales phage]|uniref:Uncharacterized protein n=1 Tax=uncultured Caudovirales phage TaxID=2100421 RepID=A0A6J5KKW2_9CAUD|nr:hypothetical protein UFOVP28_69 [uncultured Caudovirales phage]